MMAVNLLAICKQQAGLIVKRVKVTREVQTQLGEIFLEQERSFREGIEEEIQFDGGWNPDPDQLLYASLTSEASDVLKASQENIVSMPIVNARAFSHEGIRGLAVLLKTSDTPRLLLQGFNARQLLERRFNLFLDGDTFKRLTEPAFSIATSLAGIIEDDRIKFRQFSQIKLIFDLVNLYKEATEPELDSFCEHNQLEFSDAAAFKKGADQTMRKLVHAISEKETLSNFTPQTIAAAAKKEGFVIKVHKSKLVVPETKADAKVLLQFLDNGLYRGPLGGDTFITNSKRLYAPAAR